MMLHAERDCHVITAWNYNKIYNYFKSEDIAPVSFVGFAQNNIKWRNLLAAVAKYECQISETKFNP